MYQPGKFISVANGIIYFDLSHISAEIFPLVSLKGETHASATPLGFESMTTSFSSSQQWEQE